MIRVLWWKKSKVGKEEPKIKEGRDVEQHRASETEEQIEVLNKMVAFGWLGRWPISKH